MGNIFRCIPPTDLAASHLLENMAMSAKNHSVSAAFVAHRASTSLSFHVMAFRDLSSRELARLRSAYGSPGEACEMGYSSVDVLIEQVSEFFRTRENGAVVLEQPLLKRGDRRLQDLSCGIRYLDGEVYSVVMAMDAKTNILEDAILEARRMDRLIGFLVAGQAVGNMNEAELPQEFPSIVCESFRVVFTDAFDGEGLLFGKRQDCSRE
jgi:hypothetical protein